VGCQGALLHPKSVAWGARARCSTETVKVVACAAPPKPVAWFAKVQLLDRKAVGLLPALLHPKSVAWFAKPRCSIQNLLRELMCLLQVHANAQFPGSRNVYNACAAEAVHSTSGLLLTCSLEEA
jgi:hypothetical protein